VPLIVDANGEVLSMPPVINGAKTALSTRTKNVLVDVTGTDERAVLGILNILVALLALRGGRVKSLQIQRGKKTITTPDLTPQQTLLPYARVRELLGLDATSEQVAAYLARLGHQATPKNRRAADVQSPAWRL